VGLVGLLCAYPYYYEWRLLNKYKDQLYQADQKAETAIQEQLAVVDQIFQRARQRTTQYADHVLSLGGKMEYVFGGQDRFLQYARRKFDEIIFSQEQLQDMLTSLIEKYVQQVNDIDNELLVTIRLDTEGEHPKTPGTVKPPAVTLPEIMPRSLAQSIVQDIASIIVGEIVARLTLQAAVSAGIIGSSSAAGLPGLIVGIAVSVVVDEVMESIYATKATLSHDVDLKLQAMHQQARSELEQALKKYHNERKVTRRQMIVSMSR